MGNSSRDRRSGERKDSFEEITYSNSLLLGALIDVLSGKGILSSNEVEQRARDLAGEAHSHRGIGPTSPPLVSLGDLITANVVAMELLLSILCDKGLFSLEEIAALSQKLREDIRRRALEKQ